MDGSTPTASLAEVLEDRGTKQVWLARRTKIDAADISRIVNGMPPGRERAHAIAKALSVSCAECGWPEHDEAAAA